MPGHTPPCAADGFECRHVAVVKRYNTYGAVVKRPAVDLNFRFLGIYS